MATLRAKRKKIPFWRSGIQNGIFFRFGAVLIGGMDKSDSGFVPPFRVRGVIVFFGGSRMAIQRGVSYCFLFVIEAFSSFHLALHLYILELFYPMRNRSYNFSITKIHQCLSCSALSQPCLCRQFQRQELFPAP